jgi:hypothetical protein
MRNGILAAVAFFGASLVAGCGRPPVAAGDAIDGPYYLSALLLNPAAGKGVCYLRKSGVCDPRIPPSVVSLGRSADFISAGVKPIGEPDLVVYYYLVRDRDGPDADQALVLRGPYDAAAFDEERRKHGVPAVHAVISA